MMMVSVPAETHVPRVGDEVCQNGVRPHACGSLESVRQQPVNDEQAAPRELIRETQESVRILFTPNAAKRA